MTTFFVRVGQYARVPCPSSRSEGVGVDVALRSGFVGLPERFRAVLRRRIVARWTTKRFVSELGTLPATDEQPLDVAAVTLGPLPPLGPRFEDRRAALQALVDAGGVLFLHRAGEAVTAILMGSDGDFVEPATGACVAVAPGEAHLFGGLVDPAKAKHGGETKAVQFAKRHFMMRGVTRLVADVDPDNDRTIRVLRFLRFLRFREDGILLYRWRIFGLRVTWSKPYAPIRATLAGGPLPPQPIASA